MCARAPGSRVKIAELKQTAIVDRAVGGFIGLAVGDALGTTLEFSRRDEHPPVTELIGGGPFGLNPGEWTDDTSMALCLADSLLECGDLETRDLMQRFLRWRDHGENSVNGRCFDIGGGTSAALERFRQTGNPISGSTDPSVGGNGSIMRLAPIAIRWHRDPSTAIEKARLQSRTTHGAMEPVEASALLAEILVDAIRTGDRDEVLRLRSNEARSIHAIAQGSWRTKQRQDIRSSSYVVHTLEAALWSVYNANGFPEAVILAANLGEDADTVAAVTGQIAGALWGLSSIPQPWLERLAWREAIEDRARRLTNTAIAEAAEP